MLEVMEFEDFSIEWRYCKFKTLCLCIVDEVVHARKCFKITGAPRTIFEISFVGRRTAEKKRARRFERALRVIPRGNHG